MWSCYGNIRDISNELNKSYTIRVQCIAIENLVRLIRDGKTTRMALMTDYGFIPERKGRELWDHASNFSFATEEDKINTLSHLIAIHIIYIIIYHQMLFVLIHCMYMYVFHMSEMSWRTDLTYSTVSWSRVHLHVYYLWSLAWNPWILDRASSTQSSPAQNWRCLTLFPLPVWQGNCCPCKANL